MIFVWQKQQGWMVYWIVLLTVFVVLAGCASPAKKACLQTDWQHIGYQEGSRGILSKNSANQRDHCVREGMSPDMIPYWQGRQQGLEEYCTPDNGLALGTDGDSYQGVCPPELHEAFMTGYKKGLRKYVPHLKDDIQTTELLQIQLRRQLADVEEQITYLEKEITNIGAGKARLGMGMISEMNMLEDDQQSLSLQISALEMDLEEMRQRLSRIKTQVEP